MLQTLQCPTPSLELELSSPQDTGFCWEGLSVHTAASSPTRTVLNNIGLPSLWVGDGVWLGWLSGRRVPSARRTRARPAPGADRHSQHGLGWGPSTWTLTLVLDWETPKL